MSVPEPENGSPFERLKMLFKRSRCLPSLPTSAVRLIQAIDTGEASAIDLEKIITSDPGLTTSLLRISNDNISSDQMRGITTVRRALMRLGQRSVRSLAMSLAIQPVLAGKDTSSFNAVRYTRHSVFFAFLARYIHSRNLMVRPFPTKLSRDEIFAAALLHDIGVALLARVSPNDFAKVGAEAQASGYSFEQAFELVYEEKLHALSLIATEQWGLPKLFSQLASRMDAPLDDPSEPGSMACLNYAHQVAVSVGVTTEIWRVAADLDDEISQMVGLPEEELKQVLSEVAKQTANFLSGSLRAAA